MLLGCCYGVARWLLGVARCCYVCCYGVAMVLLGGYARYCLVLLGVVMVARCP